MSSLPSGSITGGHRGGPGKHLSQPKIRVKNMRSVVRRIWSLLSENKVSFYGAIILITLTTLLQTGAPYYQGVAIDEGIIGEDKSRLIYAVLVMGGIYLLTGVMSLFQNFIMIRISQQLVRKMRQDLFRKLQTLSLSYFDRTPYGELMSRMSNDIDLINQTLTSNLTQLITSIVSLAGVTVMMLVLNIRLALVALVTIPLIILITKFIAKYTRKGYKEQQQHLGRLNTLIEESVSALTTVKLFGTEDENRTAFTAVNSQLRKAAVKANIYGGIMGPTMNMMRNLNYVIVSFAGGFLAYKGLISIGLIAVFLQYTRQFSRPLNQIAQLYNELQSALAGAERVFSVMDEEPEIQNSAYPADPGILKGETEFRDVCFSYVKGQEVLKDLSFRAGPGESVAIVGETGAGKTTIVNLLTRFYDIDSGDILLDGRRIKDLDIDRLRKNLGFVLQDTVLFSASVKENIRYGKPEASDKEIQKAAELANAHHFIHRLPEGYDTVLSSEGNSLSEGQKQLLAIARVILSDPSILILDEATSSVDTRTEIHIQEALLNLMTGRTSFVIAHRLNTIRNADNILVLDRGKITEQGNHKTLMERKGMYYEFYKRASGRNPI